MRRVRTLTSSRNDYQIDLQEKILVTVNADVGLIMLTRPNGLYIYYMALFLNKKGILVICDLVGGCYTPRDIGKLLRGCAWV